MIIYKITNLVNNKVYIGQTSRTLKQRWSQHGTDKSAKCIIDNAIRKYGRKNFSLEPIETCATQEELNDRERYWIKHYKSTNRAVGYNIQEGGYKGKHSEETKKKLSEGKMGSKNPMYGKKPSKETLRKKSKALRGIKRTEQQKINQHLANSQKLEIVCLTNNKTYPSIRYAAKDLSIPDSHIVRVLKGRRRHTKGYKFRYTDQSRNIEFVPKKRIKE